MSVSDATMKEAVAFIARWDRTTANWNTDRNNLFDTIKKDALSRWENAHNWSFLYKESELELVPSYTTGTIEIVAGEVTLTSGTFPAWADEGHLWVVDDGEMRRYEVDTRDGDTQITLVNTGVAVASGTTYSLKRHYYALPDDFGGTLDWGFAFRRDSIYAGIPIERVGHAEFQLLDRELGQQTGVPCHFLLQGSSGGWRAAFTPLPGDTMFLDYRYRVVAADDDSYPFGDGIHTEAILASVRYSTAVLLNMENAADLHAIYMHKVEEGKRIDGNFRPIDYGPGAYAVQRGYGRQRHRYSSIDDATFSFNS